MWYSLTGILSIDFLTNKSCLSVEIPELNARAMKIFTSSCIDPGCVPTVTAIEKSFFKMWPFSCPCTGRFTSPFREHCRIWTNLFIWLFYINLIEHGVESNTDKRSQIITSGSGMMTFHFVLRYLKIVLRSIYFCNFFYVLLSDIFLSLNTLKLSRD